MVPTLAASLVICLAGLAAYSNSFAGPFIFDGVESIPNNPHIRSIWPLSEAMKAPPQETVSGRPILSLSLALTYAVCGEEVWGYHATNLAIHILAGLTVFAIVGRTLKSKLLKDRFHSTADLLAAVCAVLWVVHPLNTQAVTYMIQRAESLMALLYLLTLYFAIRSFLARRAVPWQIAAVFCCALGMGTKEVMVTAPLVVLLYDRAFVAGSFKKAFRCHWLLYAGLAATWLLLAAIVHSSPRGQSAGFGLEAISPVDYAKTQCQVILHYLRLALWPAGQSFDYTGWLIPAGLWGVYIPAAMIVGLVGLTAIALVFRPAIGFVGAWFFLILGPTSSFMPLADVAFEHRMYMPLAAVTVGFVITLYLLGGAIVSRLAFGNKLPALLGVFAAGIIAVALGIATHRRNEDYASELAIWRDTVEKRPDNNRAHNNLALALVASGRGDQALMHYDIAIALRGDDASTYVNRGVCYAGLGKYDKALEDFNENISLNRSRLEKFVGADLPANMRKKYASAYNNRGIIHKNKGNLALAFADYNMALDIKPDYVEALYNRAVAYQMVGQFDKSLSDLNLAISIAPGKAALYGARGATYWHKQQNDLAIRDMDKAVGLAPEDQTLRTNRQIILRAMAQQE